MPVLSDDIQLTAPAPGAVLGTSAQVVGARGLATYYYWWVSHYPVGVTVVSAPVSVRSAPNTLTATNYVIVTGQPSLGATTYDLLRTTAPRLPSGTANIAVATALITPSFNDQGGAPTAYNVAGLAAGAPVSEFINLNNRDYSQPTLVISPWPQAVQGLIFPDGTTQGTAGISAAQIYSWQQDVQANLHSLFALNKLELLNAAGFGFNFTITAVAGTFPAGTLVLQNESTGLFPFVINQAGDVWIGGPPVGARPARLSIVTPSGYATPSNPSIYCYNTVGATGASIVVEASSSNAYISLKNTLSAYTLGVSQAAGSPIWFLQDNNVSPGYRIIVQVGKIGIANGTYFTPAHLLELALDDAAKPTTNTWTISSDIRTKRNVRPLEGGMPVIDALEPIVAEYNGLASTPEGCRVVSFDPDKLAPVLPEAVKTVRRKLHPEDEEETDIKGVNNHEVIFHLILAVQQLSRQVKSLEAKQN